MIDRNQFSKEKQDYRDKMNALYNRGVKAFGYQESVLDTHKALMDLLESCAGLTASVSTAKQIARNPGRQEILDEGFDTLLIMFETCISLIEQHAGTGK